MTAPESESLAEIRKQFFALRNGLIADTLRKGGLTQKYIFGLQLPQIKEIAMRYTPHNSAECVAMARELWKDSDCREARLLACHIMPIDEISEEEALAWTEDIKSREEADILAFRLLRHLPCAENLQQRLKGSDSSLLRYASSAIARFLE